MKTQSSEEIVAQCIMERFPAAKLATEVVKRSKVFIISHRGKLVVTVDRLGTKFLFPTRGPSSMTFIPLMPTPPALVGMGGKFTAICKASPRVIERTCIRSSLGGGRSPDRRLGTLKEIVE